MKDPFKNKPLSFGQVLYAIAGSDHPNPVLVDKLRYLRRLGVPFTKEESQGSGHRLAYTFDHLFECGLAIVALGFLKPQEISQIIVNHRVALRAAGRKTLTSIGKEWRAYLDGGYDQSYDDSHIVLTGRHDPDPCNFYLVGEGAPRRGRHEQHSIHGLTQVPHITERNIPLKSLVAMLVLRGMQAPETKPGRQ